MQANSEQKVGNHGEGQKDVELLCRQGVENI